VRWKKELGQWTKKCQDKETQILGFFETYVVLVLVVDVTSVVVASGVVGGSSVVVVVVVVDADVLVDVVVL